MRAKTLGYSTLADRNAQLNAPEFGRLVRIREAHGGSRTVGYIIAIREADTAVSMIRTKITDPDTEVEDLGRVSGELLKTLGLSTGQFVRTDAM